MARIAVMCIGAAMLASSLVCGADDPAGATDPGAVAGAPAPAVEPASKPAGTDAEAPPLKRRLPAKHRTAAQGLEENVRRLSRALELDSGQQEKLRQILTDQYRQLVAFRTGQSSAPPDMVGTPMAIYERTKTRIRAMLNDEQRKKYSVEVPQDQLAPAQADLQHWMDLQESKRRQSPAAEQ